MMEHFLRSTRAPSNGLFVMSEKYTTHTVISNKCNKCSCVPWTTTSLFYTINPQEDTPIMPLFFNISCLLFIWIPMYIFESMNAWSSPLVTHARMIHNFEWFPPFDIHSRTMYYFSSISHFTSVSGFRVCLTVCLPLLISYHSTGNTIILFS